MTEVYFISKQVFSNDISYISPDRLNILTKLEYLSVGHNKLTSIPDVSGPGSTLTRLYLSSNPLAAFPDLFHLGRSLTYIELWRVRRRTTRSRSLRDLCRLAGIPICECTLTGSNRYQFYILLNNIFRLNRWSNLAMY